MKKLYLFIILLSEAAVYRNETRVEINSDSVRIVKLYLENLMKSNNKEESIFDNFRFECVPITNYNIILS